MSRRLGEPLTEEERKAIHEKLFPGFPLPPRGFGLLEPGKLFEGTPLKGALGESVYLTIPPAGIVVTTDDITIVIPILPFLPILPVIAPKVKA